MSKSKSKKSLALILSAAVLSVFCTTNVVGGNAVSNVSAEEAQVAPTKAVECLRKGAERNGWSVGAYSNGAFTEVSEGAETDYTYYTTQVWHGYKYTKTENSFAYVPDTYNYKIATDYGGPEEYLEFNYSVVLNTDAENDMAVAYTASKDGRIYYQDIAQVAPLHFDHAAEAGVYGEYRIIKLSGTETTQLYPAKDSHKLEAGNYAPTTSAVVNNYVDMKTGDKLLFVSEMNNSTVFTSPVVSEQELPEQYELKNMWKWQQINDAAYFEFIYKNVPNGDWQACQWLETKATEWDIHQRGDTEMRGVKYWFDEPGWQYASAFGGMFTHAKGAAANNGDGNVGWRFKVPHDGYVNLDIHAAGEWLTGYEVYHNETKIGEEKNGDSIFHGSNFSKKAIHVKAGDSIIIEQITAAGGPIKQDINPIITYIDDPYELDKNSITIDEGTEETLTLNLNKEFAIDASTVAWTVAEGGNEIVEITANNNVLNVKGLKAGQTVITVKAGEYAELRCEVTVNSVIKNEFTVDPLALEVETGKTGNFVVTITGDKITAADLTAMSENEEVATVAVDGTNVVVTGVKKGTTTIYISAEGSKSVSVEVTVKEAQKPVDPQPETSNDSTESGESTETEGGCGSSVGGSMILGGLFLLASGAIVSIKRRK